MIHFKTQNLNNYFLNILEGDHYTSDRDINASSNMMKSWCLEDQGRHRPKNLQLILSSIKKAKNKLKYLWYFNSIK